MHRINANFTAISDKLLAVGLRPTRQRLLLGHLLFTETCRHVSAESLFKEATATGFNISLATIYNTLNQFIDVGLLREVDVQGGRRFFDTNTGNHHHFLCEETGQLTDIPASDILLENLPLPPDGKQVSSIDVVIKYRSA